MNDLDTLTGRQLGERYRLMAAIAKSHMSVVYRGIDEITRSQVAVKILMPSASPVIVERFQREGEIASRFTHTHLVPVLDRNHDGQTALRYMVMPWLSGRTLDEILRARAHPMPMQTILCDAERVLTKIGAALDYVHAQGYVHCDVKPGNIRISEGEPYLLDFGVAQHLQHPEPADETQRGAAPPGTLQCMSPEQMRFEPLDGRSDQYAMALVIYEMLGGAGVSPYTTHKGSVHRIDTWYEYHVHKPPRPLTEICPDLSPAVWEALRRALAKDRNARHDTLTAFAQAFTAAAACG